MGRVFLPGRLACRHLCWLAFGLIAIAVAEAGEAEYPLAPPDAEIDQAEEEQAGKPESGADNVLEQFEMRKFVPIRNEPLANPVRPAELATDLAIIASASLVTCTAFLLLSRWVLRSYLKSRAWDRTLERRERQAKGEFRRWRKEAS